MADSGTESKKPWWQIIAVGRNPVVTAVRLVILSILAVVGFRYSVAHILVRGISMAPTYVDGQKIWLNRISLHTRPLERGEIVGIRYQGESVLLLKRIIALPGERVAIRRGNVLINDQILDEPYLKNPAPWNWPTNAASVLMESDEYFVIGDNRSMQQDLHEWGAVRRERIIGRVTK
jgi:signal peptidase I